MPARDRTVGQVAKDLDLTETAAREWVGQAERNAGTREDGGLTSDERRELALWTVKIIRVLALRDPRCERGYGYRPLWFTVARHQLNGIRRTLKQALCGPEVRRWLPLGSRDCG